MGRGMTATMVMLVLLAQLPAAISVAGRCLVPALSHRVGDEDTVMRNLLVRPSKLARSTPIRCA
jgi:hypothetical protein